MLGFMMAFELGKTMDLRHVVERFSESVVFCSPRLIAGPEHVSAVLFQAMESSKRGISLARNRSIEMLMRITCQRQISEAIVLSNISNTDKLAVFGFIHNKLDLDDIQKAVRTENGEMKREDSLLRMSREKARYLKQLHRLDEWLTDDQLLVALKEKSALLVLDR